MEPSIFLLFFLVFLLLSTIKTSYLSDRRIQLFRVMFPSWRFFDDIRNAPALFFRLAFENQNFGPWIDCLGKAERSWSSIFLNAEGNYRYACYSLLEQLISDLAEWDENNLAQLSESVSFQLTRNLVLYQIVNTHYKPACPSFRFQFKLSAISVDSMSGDTHDILISPEYTSEEII